MRRTILILCPRLLVSSSLQTEPGWPPCPVGGHNNRRNKIRPGDDYVSFHLSAKITQRVVATELKQGVQPVRAVASTLGVTGKQVGMFYTSLDYGVFIALLYNNSWLWLFTQQPSAISHTCPDRWPRRPQYHSSSHFHSECSDHSPHFSSTLADEGIILV
ncbi:hypothetical protein BKA67DRAFT_421126 [Truncatella angustata]|uniref:Uncharacterized protein n=1 Tax=Truncatella angustata TaxID=152316 RepID=A0A9P8UA29_9PEZI|nr:uncharacterized protein BKA67DRAFT_421126 [Truncatella angustata]KAH6646954.1 hypothetical protein BKA67DRAFT_421126 [Truncatella angustata]